MALSNVKCGVSNCRYWESGQRCNASAIEVHTDNGSGQANQSRETNCKTFETTR
ncbi:DUF1540 domain-containing protein [Acetonema longum]|uniref:DUF1540 domain-containing protein n=1 Tax=Acetonema longum DSM 6540 TaxID=1009370 RepID=F7NKH6_9FIRM|nr:DUF1540 domain-containing protein [Acetonema longum]EGO63428.1 hypothetical protein ALO_12950 [Acetonema longum DSM 6540]